MPEGTPRLIKQFMQIGAGIALANGRNVIDDEIYSVLKKSAATCYPPNG